MRYEIFQRERRGDHQYVAAHFWESARDRRKTPAVTNDFKLHLPKAFTAARDEVIDAELRAYAARAFARGWHGDRRGTTSVYQVSAGGDDGWVNDSALLDDNNTDVQVGGAGGIVYHGWYRFTGVSGLAGATINSCLLSLYGHIAEDGSPVTTLQFDLDPAPTNPSDLTDFNGARSLSASAAWSPPGLSTSGWTDSPELATLLQEVIDTPGDPSALLIMHKDNGSSSSIAYAYAYDGNPSLAAKLTIDSSQPAVYFPPVLHPRVPRPIYRR